jgi:hypothetical protein
MPAPAQQGNGFGVTALVLGIIGLILGVIPVINIFTGLPLGILAIIFGIVALVKAKSRGGKGKGTGMTGLILGVLALIASVTVYFVLYSAVKSECEDPNSVVYGTPECAELM